MSMSDHELDFYLSRDVESLGARGTVTAPAAGDADTIFVAHLIVTKISNVN